MDVAVASLAAAAVLALVYVLRGGSGEHALSERLWARRRWISAAAGVSVAYVFVDVLPELAVQSAVIAEAAGDGGLHFAEQRIYLLALVAFVVLYGLEHIVLASREGAGAGEAPAVRDGVYWLHLAGYAAYSALVGSLLVERAERGAGTLAIYALAMAIHFLIVNHALVERHGEAYRRGGHWWPAAAVLAGWAIGIVAPLSETAFARLFALLAGGVVITSLRAELPDAQRGRFWPFVLGAAAFAALLLATA